MTHIVLCGCGHMGRALLSGWCADAGGLTLDVITVIDPAFATAKNKPDIKPSNPGRSIAYYADAKAIGDGVDVPADMQAALPANMQAALPADIVVLATKPQDTAQAISGISHLANKNTAWLSIAAGLSLAWLEKHIGTGKAIFRAMPNTPAAIGMGITALASRAETGGDSLTLAKHLLEAGGQVVVVEEKLMDAITATSGSGPAYVYALQEAMEVAAIELGIDADLARQLTIATIRGAAEMMAETDAPPPAELRQHISSPGGTTLAALAVLADKKGGLAALMRRAMEAATKKASTLGK